MSEFLQLLKLARPYWGWLALGVLLSLMTSAAGIILLALSGWFLATMALAGVAGSQVNYFTPAAIIRFLAIVRSAGRYAERLVSHQATLQILKLLRVSSFAKLIALLPGQLPRARSADLVSRLQGDVEHLDSAYLALLVPVLVALLGTPILLLVLASFDFQLAALLAVGFIVQGLWLPARVHHKSKRAGQKQRIAASEFRSQLTDFVLGQRELSVYLAGERRQQQLQASAERYGQLVSEPLKIAAANQTLALVTVNLCLLAALLVLVPQVASGELPPVQLPMLALLVLAGFELVLPLPSAFAQLAVISASAKRVFGLPQVERPVTPLVVEQQPADDHGVALAIDGLNFSYPKQPSVAPVLSDFSLNLARGQQLVITGASGSGKSTLVNLLAGFWQPSSGTISLSGGDLTGLTAEQRHSRVAILSQHSYLFEATVRENLLLANPEACEEQMQQLLETLGLTQWLADLPSGLDSWLGETGSGLSGGQARRLQIAQLLLQQAPLVVLDEPTEGLDRQTERQLIADLKRLLADRALLIISHSPQVLASFEQVAWLESGRLRQIASHQQLLNNSDYRQLVAI